MRVKITNKSSYIYGQEYEVIYIDGKGYRILVMGTLIYVAKKDCEVL